MRSLACFVACASLVLACSDGGKPASEDPVTEPPPSQGSDPDPEGEPPLELPEVGFGTLSAAVSDALELDASGLADKYRVPFQNGALSYEPREAQGLELIQASELALNPAELERLGENGFAILPRREYPSFPYAYQAIYSQDLPVFLSADMILEAVHRSYDSILLQVELQALKPRLERVIATMRDRLDLGEVALEPQAARDADLFLTVALSLLQDRERTPVTDLPSSEVTTLFAAAKRASGTEVVELFGGENEVDFSQFTLRGHYEGSGLEGYFRALIWLGRVEFRLIESMPDGSRLFRRRALEAALGLRALMNEQAFLEWSAIDEAITFFVGEHDYMTLPELDGLLAHLGLSDASALTSVDDARIAQAIVDGLYGEQRIASQIVRKWPSIASQTLPLSASLAFMGQRYVPDSHVLSNVVYDRAGGGTVPRVVPDPLDVAFAALANDQAVSLLASELSSHDYAGDLAAMRALIDAHPEQYWSSSLYSAWLGTLRTLSPNALLASADASGLPEVVQSEAWGRRLLNTQLASWAELRHDTILYAKQSYSGTAACEFPSAYVEPVPEFFYGMVQLAELGHQRLGEIGIRLGVSLSGAQSWFERLAAVSTTLAKMAEQQRTGEPHTPSQLEFANQAISFQTNCDGSMIPAGWYAELFIDSSTAVEFDPTIADVHTDPGGPLPVSREPSVLHAGTGYPRLMVVTRESCEGPRAYVGAVFSYHQEKAEGFTRYTDSDWSARLERRDAPPDVEWLSPVLAPR